MKNMLKEKGITLVSLIITIIILIALAGITLSIALDENGIFAKSKLAADKYKEKEQTEISDLDETYLTFRRLEGKGEKVYNITDETVPNFIKSGLNTENLPNNYSISFINYDSSIKSDKYTPPTVYKAFNKGTTIELKLDADYKLYLYACANDNYDNKGNIEVKTKNNELITTYSLPNRKKQDTEPLIVNLKEGEYSINTTYNAMLFKIQLDPIVIHDNNKDNNSSENTDENNSLIIWDAPTDLVYTLPNWLSLTTAGETRKGDKPFIDTSITNSIKFKNGFSIILKEKTYNIEIYITGNNDERNLTLNGDNNFSQVLKNRNEQGQSPIILENKTGTLNFNVNGESQLYKIILTEVK